MKKIVTVQDISCYGQCSITVALPVLSSFGIETAILPSAILSSHTGGFSNYSVLDLTDEMPKIIENWKLEGIRFDAIYTGYIGDCRQFSMIRQMRSLLKEGGKLIVDPAMADHGKLYKALSPNIVAGMRSLVFEADMIFPNLTETALLLGEEYREALTTEEIKASCKRLSALGPETVVITGVEDGSGGLGAILYEKQSDSFVTYFAKKQPRPYHGTGDLFASVAIAMYLNGNAPEEILKTACEFVVDAIRETEKDPSHSYGVKFEQVLKKRRMPD